MSITYADNILPSSTGFDLGNPTQQWDVYAQTLVCSGAATFSGTLAISTLEDIRFADQFSGAGVSAKIDTALADAASLLVLVPTSMGAGNATAIALGKSVLDLRSGYPKIFTNYSVSNPAFEVNDAGAAISPAFTSITANASGTGAVRLANADAIKIRNSGNTADLNLASMSGNILALGGSAGCSMSGPLVISGALSGVTTLSFSGTLTTGAQIVSTLATGTAPFSITSTTVVPNLNINRVNGVVVSGAAASGYILQASSASAATWVASSPSSTILNKQDVAAAMVGDSTDKVMYTYSMPSGTLAAGKGIRITFHCTHTTGTASTTYKVTFGGTNLLSTATTSVNTISTYSIVLNNTGSTTAQWASTNFVNFDSSPIAAFVSPAENTNSGAPIVIKATFNVANTDQVTPKGWLVELIT